MSTDVLEEMQHIAALDFEVTCEDRRGCDKEATWEGHKTCPCNQRLLFCDEHQRLQAAHTASIGDAMCGICEADPVFIEWTRL